MKHFKYFETFNMPEMFYHYTSKQLLSGDIIYSNQTEMQTYSVVWKVYAKVYYEMFNKEFPKSYGYAYPEKKDKLKVNEYIVRPYADVIFGNFNHSVYYTMDGLGRFIDKSLPLKERLILRDEQLKEEAIRYFTLIEYPQYVEAICEKFVVI